MHRRYFVLTGLIFLVVSEPFPGTVAQSEGRSHTRRNRGGKPEHVLAGIDISGEIEQVIAKYGEPDVVRNVTVEGSPQGSGERNYIWKKGLTTTSVTTGHHVDTAGEQVESETYEIEVMGRSAEGEIGKTGAGLALGDTRNKASKIYGDLFHESQIYKSPLRGNHVPVLAVEWQNGTRLCIALDERDRINFIALMAPVD